MNIQSGRRSARKSMPVREQGQLAGRLFFTFKLILFGFVLAGIFNCHIYLRQQITVTRRSIRKTDADIRQIERELENLRIRRSELTKWPYIQARIAHYGLKLQPAEAGQMRRMRLYSPAQAAGIPLAPVRIAANRMDPAVSGVHNYR